MAGFHCRSGWAQVTLAPMPDNAKPLILLTRPQSQAERFAAALHARTGGATEVLIAPLLRIELLALPQIPDGAALVFTSENGVAAYAAGGGAPGRIAYCVGDRTAEAAGQAGVRARSAGGTAEDLIALIVAEAPACPLVHLHGRHVRGAVVASLSHHGFAITGHAVYDQVALPLPAAARGALLSGQKVLVPLFSPRSAQLFAKALPDGTKCRPVCISVATRAALPPALGARASVAEAPTGAAMLNAVTRQLSP